MVKEAYHAILKPRPSSTSIWPPALHSVGLPSYIRGERVTPLRFVSLRPALSRGTPNAILSEANIDYVYNVEKNRLIAAGSASFNYDDEGQLSDLDGSILYFDCEHRLTNINGMVSCQYFYDGQGKRLKAIRDGETSYYIYDVFGNLLA